MSYDVDGRFRFSEIDEGLLEMLLKYSLKHSKPELTAYFLDLKNRKFGFKKDSDLEL